MESKEKAGMSYAVKISERTSPTSKAILCTSLSMTCMFVPSRPVDDFKYWKQKFSKLIQKQQFYFIYSLFYLHLMIFPQVQNIQSSNEEQREQIPVGKSKLKIFLQAFSFFGDRVMDKLDQLESFQFQAEIAEEESEVPLKEKENLLSQRAEGTKEKQRKGEQLVQNCEEVAKMGENDKGKVLTQFGTVSL